MCYNFFSRDVLGVFADVLVQEGAVLGVGVAVGRQHLAHPERPHEHCGGDSPDEPLLHQRPVRLLDLVFQEEEGGGGDGQPGLRLGLGAVSALDSCLNQSRGARVPVEAVHPVDFLYLGLVDCDAGARVRQTMRVFLIRSSIVILYIFFFIEMQNKYCCG